MSMHFRRIAALAGVFLFLAGCQTSGDIENPAVRKFTWFSYVNGDDLRAACDAGSPARHRMIYNGIYNDQVRIYNFEETGSGGTLNVRIVEPENLLNLRLSAGGLLDPWRGTIARTEVRTSDATRLERGLAAAGVYDPPPVGLRMHSDDFYWVVGSCVSGRFSFSAYRWPSDRFEKTAGFADLLFTWDQTGIDVNQPRRVDRVTRKLMDPTTTHNQFILQVGHNGLIGQQGG